MRTAAVGREAECSSQRMGVHSWEREKGRERRGGESVCARAHRIVSLQPSTPSVFPVFTYPATCSSLN
ncbi:hypothetical protein C0Q70_14860 [Pomacea canaliculata]|uniref:Uncharacterized protein n=1 Tax=Pomacea canaliculata TaxID=400727 RepID=A0A2T7NT76_POMCA|nr:hypothetical protein C0Q70_14860 [Pomacea canaliculata]